jgi:hypothetical protein
MTGNGRAPHIHGDEDELDGCACDVELEQGEVTLDVELPAATGGVEPALERHGVDSDDIDGCELDFNEGQPTIDEELPAATRGGA